MTIREREVLAQQHAAKLDEAKRKELQLKMARSTLNNIKNEYSAYMSSIRNLSKVGLCLCLQYVYHDCLVALYFCCR